MRRGRQEWQPIIKPQDVGWWVVKATKNHPQTQDNLSKATDSIYRAQVPRIGGNPAVEYLVSQYEGLEDWRDVAIKELRRIGWHINCVYESNQYSDLDQIIIPNWGKIIRGHTDGKANIRRVGRKTISGIYIMTWMQKDAAVATTRVISKDSPVVANTITLGGSLNEQPCAHAGVALVEGLTQ